MPKSKSPAKYKHVRDEFAFDDANPMIFVLPSEVFAKICRQLDTKDLVHLAKTCKKYYKFLSDREAAHIWILSTLPTYDNSSEAVSTRVANIFTNAEEDFPRLRPFISQLGDDPWNALCLFKAICQEKKALKTHQKNIEAINFDLEHFETNISLSRNKILMGSLIFLGTAGFGLEMLLCAKENPLYYTFGSIFIAVGSIFTFIICRKRPEKYKTKAILLTEKKYHDTLLQSLVREQEELEKHKNAIETRFNFFSELPTKKLETSAAEQDIGAGTSFSLEEVVIHK